MAAHPVNDARTAAAITTDINRSGGFSPGEVTRSSHSPRLWRASCRKTSPPAGAVWANPGSWYGVQSSFAGSAESASLSENFLFC